MPVREYCAGRPVQRHSSDTEALEHTALKDPLYQRKNEVAQKASSQNKLSLAGDWLAPALVWFLVITMGLAIAGFLIGNR